MKHLFLLSFLISFAHAAFSQSNNFDIQGHRGARGYAPENTVSAFIEGIKRGCTTLELDVVISKDSIVVISHEPWFNSAITLTPSGDTISTHQGRQLNLYHMNYSEISQYDVGTKINQAFPEQYHVKESKPALKDAVNAVEYFAAQQQLPKIFYNIEIKSLHETDSIYHPVPKEFARLVYMTLLEADVLDRATIQSFDIRSLREMKLLDGSVPLSLLVSNIDGVEKNLERLGFVPEIYSPSHQLLNEGMVRQIKTKGMKLIPWTVNKPHEIQRMLGLGVDGIISDYPDRVVSELKRK